MLINMNGVNAECGLFPSCDGKKTQVEVQSLADALIGVVVVAVVPIQLVSIANAVPHLFDPQH